MKLRAVLNFTNILHTIFLYKRRFSNYFLALTKNLFKKCVHIMLMKLRAGLNFSNILRTFFIGEQIKQLFSNYIPLCNFLGSKILTKNERIKCWWNWWQVQISPTFYNQLFGTKVFLQWFELITVLLCNFLSKEYWHNCACKMLVKLTTGVIENQIVVILIFDNKAVWQKETFTEKLQKIEI